MRLIDADALLDEVIERYCKDCDKRKGVKSGKYRIVYNIGDAPCRACSIDDMKDELENAPTIEPERKGKWKGYNADDPNWLRTDGSPVFIICSECGQVVLNNISAHWNYCSNCGCKMEVEE